VARTENGPCPEQGLNPFYSGEYYFELDTKKYWDELAKTDKNNLPSAFEPTAFTTYQCLNL
jgi:hypothetical protein